MTPQRVAVIGLTLLLVSCSNAERDTVRRDGAYVNPADYDQSCTTHSDCTMVTTRFNCVGGWGCPSDAVSVDGWKAFQTELERQRQLCDNPDANSGASRDCSYDENPAAVCLEERCTFLPDISCLEDADCAQPYGDTAPLWSFPERVRCEDFLCRECEGERFQSDCPDGYACAAYPEMRAHGVCEALAPCEDASDCGGDPYYGTQFGCRDGLCSLCIADTDCSADQFCQSEKVTVAPPPNVGDVPGFDIPLGCYAEGAIDTSCLDGTCPTWCEPEGTDTEWRCTEPAVNPYPGVDFPELSDFDTTCSADNDCTEVTTRRWTDTCECRCDVYSLNTNSAAAYEAAWPETKTRYGCEAEPDCACPELAAYCGDQCLVR